VSHRDQILHSALERFALDGFLATSVQHIADDSGVSKATVLYHFASKEDLLQHAITPALDEFQKLLDGVGEGDALADPSGRKAFVDAFVPFLITNRLGIHIIVTHAHLAHSHPALIRAMTLMSRIAEIVERSSTSPIDALRFGVALSGATYSLVSETLLGMDKLDPAELEQGLKAVLTEMLQPTSPVTGER
jgi:AcrR family transcriptional regulator